MARLATNVLIRDRVVSVDEYLDAVGNVSADDAQRIIADITAGAASTSVVRSSAGRRHRTAERPAYSWPVTPGLKTIR